MRKSLIAVLGSAVVLSGAGPVHAQDIWTGVSESRIATFGKGATANFGQTFTVGSENVLDSFSMWLWGSSSSSPALLFDAFIMGWDGAKVTGPILYETTTAQVGPNTGETRRYAFQTGGLDLSAGQTYVAFLSISNRYDEIAANAAYTHMPQTVTSYAGGNFVYMHNRDFGALSTVAWSQASWLDVAFAADFSAAATPPAGPGTVTPEPVSMALLGTGLAGLGAVRRRRRKEAETA